MKTKICSRLSCPMSKMPQPISNFYKWSRSPDGYAYICKTCDKQIRFERAQRNLGIHVDPTTTFRICTSLNCPHNGKEQQLKNFFKDKKGPFGYGNTCKDCESDRWKRRKRDPQASARKREADLEWRKKNVEKKRETDRLYHERKGRAYYDANSDAIKKKAREYSKKNRKHITEKRNKKRREDPQYLLSERLRIRLYHSLKGRVKRGSAVKDLGCDISYLKNHLERQFHPNPETGEPMSWDNYGHKGWHVDHIIPISVFNLENEQEVLAACHFSNLRPLWAAINIGRNKGAFKRSKDRKTGRIDVAIVDKKLLIEKEILINWSPSLKDERVFKHPSAKCAEVTAIALAVIHRTLNISERTELEKLSEELFNLRPNGNPADFNSYCAFLEHLQLKPKSLNIGEVQSYSELQYPIACRLKWTNESGDGLDRELSKELNTGIAKLGDNSHVVLLVGYDMDEFLIWDPNFSFINPFVWWPAKNIIKRMQETTLTQWFGSITGAMTLV